jgi:hypothetical protein
VDDADDRRIRRAEAFDDGRTKSELTGEAIPFVEGRDDDARVGLGL